MKRTLITSLLASALLFGGGCSDDFDDSALWKGVDEIYNQLTELDKSAEQKPLPEEPKEQGFYVTANDGRLLLKDIDDDWSARTWDDSANPIWNGNRPYVKWPTVCETLPPEAFPLKRVNTGSDDD